VWYYELAVTTKALVKWLLLPSAGALVALDAGPLIEAIELGDPYAWLTRTPWTSWLGFGLFLLAGFLLLLFRVRPEYGVWFTYVPFVRMWKQMHSSRLMTGTVRFRGAQWEVKLDGDLLKDSPDLKVRLSRSDDAEHDRDASRIRRLVLEAHELYLRQLLRSRQQ